MGQHGAPRQVDLRLDGVAHGGEAFGRVQGRAVFVPFAIPGELVRVELLDEKPRWARARLLEVLEPSADRVVPPCPYFGPEKCGGCQWQHIAYERQLGLKQEIVVDQLRRLGHLSQAPVADIVALAAPAGTEAMLAGVELLSFGYRNQTRFAVAPDGRLGYPGALPGQVVPVERCMLLHQRLDELHGALDLQWPSLTGVSLRAGINTGQALVLLETSGSEQPELEVDLPAAIAVHGRDGVRPVLGQPWIDERISERTFRVSAESDFPANTTGAEALVEIVSSYLEPGHADSLLDVYCGVGLFALSLAGALGPATGIEASHPACEDFAANAEAHEDIALHEGNVQDVFPALRAQGLSANLVVMNPPVAGAGSGIIGQLPALGARRVAYVSSDPAALARDSEHFGETGFHLVEAQPVDMLPQTRHVATVALWEREA
jgi:tRNA/tmRNA/rRNA uracil-C5-methylase (TrmA/RlmC/RlmD family)